MGGKVRITLQTLRVLRVLLADPPRAHYGLEISKESDLPTGSIYPILKRLEAAGWVVSDWEDIDEASQGRRRRRYYNLTDHGRELAWEAVHGTDGPYPIVESVTLDPVPRSGLLGLGTRRRELDSRLAPRADYVRVFLVDGRYIVDYGRLKDDDETVVRATQVSIVDLTPNRPVQVEATIPSQEAKDFTVRVTFLCTVSDAVTVVRQGLGNAAKFLLAYVGSYQELYQFGLNYKISAVNDVRRLVQVHLQAYYHHVPPDAPGMWTVLSNVQVLTPDVLIPIENEQLENEQNHMAPAEQALLTRQLEHALALESQRKDFELMLREQRRGFASRLDVIRELAKHGHLDETSIEGIQALVDRMLGTGGAAPPPAGATAGLQSIDLDHLGTLATRGNLAHWRGQAGDPAGAAAALEELLADQMRVLGPDHLGTLATRGNLAHWRGQAGDPAGAAAALEELLADQMRVLGPDHPGTLATRGNLARWRHPEGSG